MSDVLPVRSYNAAIASKLDLMPARIRALPISESGFPIPWFVAWFDGVADFRVVDTPKLRSAYKRKLCWVCGEQLGRNMAMVLGPMCIINRTISEPPSHPDCARFSACACPFLANPRMRRNTTGLPAHQDAAGEGLKRNPGAVAVWITRGYRAFNDGKGGALFTFDDSEQVEWYAEGGTASREQVMASIVSGLPLLRGIAESEGAKAVAALEKMTTEAMRYLPAA